MSNIITCSGQSKKATPYLNETSAVSDLTNKTFPTPLYMGKESTTEALQTRKSSTIIHTPTRLSPKRLQAHGPQKTVPC